MMTLHPAFLRARLNELKLLAEEAPPAERSRLEGTASVLARAIETLVNCREAVQRTDALLDHDTDPQGMVWFSHDHTPE